MYKHSLAVLAVAAAVSGCSTMENPVDYVTFRNEPLVKQVERGMTKEQVRTLGGPPSSEVQNDVTGGTCNNYVMNVDGLEQPYYVDFDLSERVDNKGFMTCEQHQGNQRKRL
jgi:osmotically inducible lipoprotein OsmE